MAIGMGECREKVRSMMIEVCYGVGYIFMKRRRRLIGV
jgi:hypothetical protein